MSIATIGARSDSKQRLVRFLGKNSPDCRHFTSVAAFLESAAAVDCTAVLVEYTGNLGEALDSVRMIQAAYPRTPAALVLAPSPHDAARNEEAARIASRHSRPEEAAVPRGGPLVRVGSYELDLSGRIVTCRGVRRHLSPNSFMLAAVLFCNPQQAISAERLKQMIWGSAARQNSRALATLVSRLRHQLGLDSNSDVYLAPVYGHGYRLDVAARAVSSAMPPSEIPLEDVHLFPM